MPQSIAFWRVVFRLINSVNAGQGSDGIDNV